VYDHDNDDDDDDEEDADIPTTAGVAPSSSLTTQSPSKKATNNDENEDEEAQALAQAAPSLPPTVLHWTLPEAPQPTNETTSLHITKLPNLVGIQTQAFDPDQYSTVQEEEEFDAAVHNLMRWRYRTNKNNNNTNNNASTDNNHDTRESNTRLVEWEDGSWTLHIGKEVFPMDSLVTTTPDHFAGINGYLYLSQTASTSTGATSKATDPTTTTMLECLGPMTSRWTIRPTSLQSEAHQALTLAVRQKTIKKARIANYVTQHDPEQLKAERIKLNADWDKANNSKRGPRPGGGGGGGRGPSKPRMHRDYLEPDEDDEDFDTTNIRALKRGAFANQKDDDMDDYGDDFDNDEDEDEDGFGRRPRSKRGRGGGDEDDDDDVFHRVSKNRAERRKGAASKARSGGNTTLADSSDEDDDVGGGSSKATGAADAPKDSHEDDDDDDEEINVVKKSTTTKKRSHTALFDDDDDDDSD